MTKNDLTFFNNVRNDSVEYLHNNTKFCIDDVKKWFKTTDNKYYIVSNGDDNIGYFRTSNWKNNSCYIGMDIEPINRGKGFAQIAYPIFMEYIFNTFKIKTFYLEVLKTNRRAIHIYKKIGFEVISEDKENLKMIRKH